MLKILFAKLFGLLATAALITGLTLLISQESPVWFKAVWALGIFYCGRGFADVTMWTADSLGGLAGYLGSPLLTAALFFAGTYTQIEYFWWVAGAHVAGMIWIGIIWRVFFLRGK